MAAGTAQPVHPGHGGVTELCTAPGCVQGRSHEPSTIRDPVVWQGLEMQVAGHKRIERQGRGRGAGNRGDDGLARELAKRRERQPLPQGAVKVRPPSLRRQSEGRIEA